MTVRNIFSLLLVFVLLALPAHAQMLPGVFGPRSVTFEALDSTGDVGTAGGQLAEGNHTHAASEVSYDNATSSLSATNVQTALDALEALSGVSEPDSLLFSKTEDLADGVYEGLVGEEVFDFTTYPFGSPLRADYTSDLGEILSLDAEYTLVSVDYASGSPDLFDNETTGYFRFGDGTADPSLTVELATPIEDVDTIRIYANRGGSPLVNIYCYTKESLLSDWILQATLPGVDESTRWYTLDFNQPGTVAAIRFRTESSRKIIYGAANLYNSSVVSFTGDFTSGPWACEAISLGQSSDDYGYVLEQGLIRDDDWDWTAPNEIWINENGTMSQTEPAGWKQKIGRAMSADVMWFDPQAPSTALLLVTNTKSAAYTIGTDDPDEAYGGITYVTGNATLTVPAVAAGMSFTVIVVGDYTASIDPNASDKIWLDGVALDDGDKITSPGSSGDMAEFTYYSADGWFATTNSWTDGS